MTARRQRPGARLLLFLAVLPILVLPLLAIGAAHGPSRTSAQASPIRRATFAALRDTTIYPQENGRIPHGEDHHLLVAGGGDTAPLQARVKILFDLPSLMGKTVTRAALRLYQPDEIGFGPIVPLRAARLAQPFPADTIALGFTPTSSIYPDYSDTIMVGATAFPHGREFDVTTIVKLWVAGTPNYGFLIDKDYSRRPPPVAGHYAIPFHSRDAANAWAPEARDFGVGNAPVLNVWYTDLPPLTVTPRGSR